MLTNVYQASVAKILFVKTLTEAMSAIVGKATSVMEKPVSQVDCVVPCDYKALLFLFT